MSYDWRTQERVWEYRDRLMREVKISPAKPVLNDRPLEQIVIMGDDDSYWEPRPE